MQTCRICQKPVETQGHPEAEVSHMACAMETAYGGRGEDPAMGLYGDDYRAAVAKRAEQTA